MGGKRLNHEKTDTINAYQSIEIGFRVSKINKKRGGPPQGAPFFSTKNLSGIEKIGVERC